MQIRSPNSTVCSEGKDRRDARSCRSGELLLATLDEPGVLPSRALWSAREARERSAVARLRRRWDAHSGLSVMACLCKHAHILRHSARSRHAPPASLSQEGAPGNALALPVRLMCT